MNYNDTATVVNKSVPLFLDILWRKKKKSKLLPSGWVFPFAAADSDFRAGVARRCALMLIVMLTL